MNYSRRPGFKLATDASISAENVAFMQSLANCLAGSRIQKLELDHNQVNGQFLATIIDGNKNLKILSVNSIGLGSWNEADIKYLCSAIASSSLEAMFMSQNRLGELECLPILGDAISCCRTLSTLSIPGNNIGDHKDAVDFFLWRMSEKLNVYFDPKIVAKLLPKLY